MLCYVTLCYVTLCYVMLHYVMLCYIILYYITLFYRIYMQVRHLCHHLWRGLTVSLKKNAKWWIFWPSKRPFFLELIFSPFLSNFSKILKHHIQTYHGWPLSVQTYLWVISALPYQRDPKNLPVQDLPSKIQWALSENSTLW